MNNKEIKREVQENKAARAWMNERYGVEETPDEILKPGKIDIIKEANQVVRKRIHRFAKDMNA